MTINTLLVLKSHKLIDKVNWQDLCNRIGIWIEKYNNDNKTFGMEEVKLFAQLLAPQYGIAVYNSLTANNKVFESSTSDQKIISRINLHNLNNHFSAITKLSGFFGTHYWCKLCNKCNHDKEKHKCTLTCIACKTLETENCNFSIRKRLYIAITISRTFMEKHVLKITKMFQVTFKHSISDTCFTISMYITGKKKQSVWQLQYSCKYCTTEFFSKNGTNVDTINAAIAKNILLMAVSKQYLKGYRQAGWSSGLLIGKGMSLKSKGIIYTTCIRPAMLYGSETWPTKIDHIRKMQRSEIRMLRWMTGVNLSERKSNEWVRNMLVIDDIAEVMWQNRLRWFGHVERRDELCWIKRIETLQVDDNGVKGRSKKRWREVLREDMREKGLCREDAWDRWRWRRMLWEGHRWG